MNNDHAAQDQKAISKIEVGQVEAISPHNQAIYEAGKAMIADSIKTGRDFCQFMITTSISAIPVYLAIITFLLPKDYSLDILISIVVTGPAVLFLVAALIFIYGYFPTGDYFSLDIIEEIETARKRNIKRRQNITVVGLITFAFAILYTITVFIINIGAR